MWGRTKKTLYTRLVAAQQECARLRTKAHLESLLRQRAEEDLAATQAEITQARAALDKVITLDGITGPLGMLVQELCRDHDELEARIEAVLTLPGVDPEVQHLLRGGTRVPDTLGEIEG